MANEIKNANKIGDNFYPTRILHMSEKLIDFQILFCNKKNPMCNSCRIRDSLKLIIH